VRCVGVICNVVVGCRSCKVGRLSVHEGNECRIECVGERVGVVWICWRGGRDSVIAVELYVSTVKV